MEVDFDKEIDTLLRKAQRDGPVYVGDFASQGHLDADQISAFAENAMPEKSRAMYLAHMADCDRCRKILSNVLTMNAEAVPAGAESLSAITIAERSAEPWYKRLLLFPNLAYVMGGLVLVFSGFLAYTVIQRSSPGSASIISQVSDSDPRGGPNFQTEPEFQTSTETANMANASSNAAANAATAIPNAAANSNAATGSAPLGDNATVGKAQSPENSFVLDGTSTADMPAAPAPTVATKVAPKDAKEREEDAKLNMAAEEQPAGANIQELAKKEAIQKQQQYQTTPSQSGPMTNNQSQYNRQLERLDRSAAEKRKAVARAGDSESGRRSVGGRTFERKQGVWYDSAYQGSPTVNVRRGSAEFNRLDSGLRSIANSLGGTVVAVWGSRAYRIQ